MILLLTEGQVSDYRGAERMLPALPDANTLLADRGYDADWFREALAERDIEPCIGGFQREVQHYQAFETVQLSRIALENLMESETLALDRIASPTKNSKALNSASVALRAGTQDGHSAATFSGLGDH